MRSTVAVRVLGTPSKQEALLFTKVVTAHPPIHPATEALHDYLEENGVLERYKIPLEVQYFRSDSTEDQRQGGGPGTALYAALQAEHNFSGDRLGYARHLSQLEEAYKTRFRDWWYIKYALELVRRLADSVSQPVRLEELLYSNELDKYFLDHGTRVLSGLISEKEYPIITGVLTEGLGPHPMQSNARSHSVYEAVLAKFPTPSETTPWEAIVEYRREKTVEERFLALHRWMDKTIRGDIPLHELGDELDHLVNEYAAHMRVARMEFRHGVMRAFFTLPLEIGEAVISQDWSSVDWKKVLTTPLEIRQHRIALHKAELSALGRDVSYIVQSRDRFRQ